MLGTICCSLFSLLKYTVDVLKWFPKVEQYSDSYLIVNKPECLTNTVDVSFLALFISLSGLTYQKHLLCKHAN